VLGVLEADADRLADRGGLAVEVLDVALLLEDPRHLHLQARGGDLHLLLARAGGVSDPGPGIRGPGGLPRPRPTNPTWSCRGCTPRERPRAGRSGRGRTCGSTPAGARSDGSGCSCATCTWICGPGGPSAKS